MFWYRSHSHSWSPHQPSHSRPLTSKSTSHPCSSKRRRSRSRSRSPHKQRAKFCSRRRRSISQSPPRKRSRFCSPRLGNSTRSPRSHRWGSYFIYCRTQNSMVLLVYTCTSYSWFSFTELEPDFQILALRCCCSMYHSFYSSDGTYTFATTNLHHSNDCIYIWIYR